MISINLRELNKIFKKFGFFNYNKKSLYWEY
jgi:hypothetical protein